MLSWLIAALAGVAVAVVHYGGRETRRDRRALLPALLRAMAVTLIVALLLGAPAGRSRRPPPLVALDASASWLRGGDSTGWAEATARAARLGRDSVLLVGDSLRVGRPSGIPDDRSSRVRPAVDRALADGRTLILLTDGEIADPEATRALPSGSRVEVFDRGDVVDGALVAMALPRAAVGGDTIELRLVVGAGNSPTPGGRLSVAVEGRSIATQPVEPLSPWAQREMSVPLRLPAGDGMAVVEAILDLPGDREARNDTLRTTIDVSDAARVVFVSTSPDFDARFALGVLRGALALPTRGYFRVAPGEWRQDGSLEPVPEREVREAVRNAPVVVLHGDSLIFGPPRGITRGSLALIAPPRERTRGGDWYAVGAPPSPLSATLAALPWDSLAPLDVSLTMPRGEWVGLEVARGRRFERRPAVVGADRPRRIVIVGAAGFWRWQFRGGIGVDAFASLWGTIFDWLAAERREDRPALAELGVLRAGDPVRWRRGAASDSTLALTIRERGGDGGVDSVMLRFVDGATIADAPPLAPGEYDVASIEGTTVIAVNPSSEMLPRRPALRSGRVGGAPALASAPTVRTIGWIYLIAVLLLSLEWLIRRRLGLR